MPVSVTAAGLATAARCSAEPGDLRRALPLPGRSAPTGAMPPTGCVVSQGVAPGALASSACLTPVCAPRPSLPAHQGVQVLRPCAAKSPATPGEPSWQGELAGNSGPPGPAQRTWWGARRARSQGCPPPPTSDPGPEVYPGPAPCPPPLPSACLCCSARVCRAWGWQRAASVPTATSSSIPTGTSVCPVL